MKKSNLTELTLSLLAAGALCVTAHAAEEKEATLSMDKVPAPAAAALKSAAGGAEITSVELDDEDGTVKGYEAAFTVNGRKHEVSVTKEGKVYCKEEELPLSEAPAAVKAAIKKKAAGEKIATVERAEEKGKVTYEAMIGAAEYEFGADGAFIAKEEAEKGEAKGGKKED